VIEHADQVTILEAKAEQTITSEVTTAVMRIAKVFAAVKKPRVVAVYGGEAAQTRSEVRLVRWSQLDASVL
jgi:hypothetical protein